MSTYYAAGPVPWAKDVAMNKMVKDEVREGMGDVMWSLAEDYKAFQLLL